ncbi:hypothetical protein RJ639_008710 [Escallonia herrerae]|uniref:Uncharacterized protein n=1 Tax=Escallonia herrerae TaxID=1293975 RepID=A0AA89ATJ2_9ASTE|nr:hypothetical protein RJ639_008710 [Escallonia herrerae]
MGIGGFVLVYASRIKNPTNLYSSFDLKDRLARLEAAIASKEDSGKEELVKKVAELENQLDVAKKEQVSEREKALKEVKKLAVENAKLQYRIAHLVQALKEADSKLEAM